MQSTLTATGDMAESGVEIPLRGTTAFREYFRKEIVPASYHLTAHISFNIGLLLLAMLAPAFMIRNASLLDWAFFLLPLLLGNFVVYFAHRYLLHGKQLAPTAYKIHTLWHHRFYTHEHSTWEKSRDFYILFFPPVVVATFVAFGLPLIFWSMKWLIGANAGYFMVIGSALYFVLYEFVHFASHVPEGHFLLKSKFLAYMRAYHLLHHNPLYMNRYHFNIVYPLADWIFRAQLPKPTGDGKQDLQPQDV